MTLADYHDHVVPLGALGCAQSSRWYSTSRSPCASSMRSVSHSGLMSTISPVSPLKHSVAPSRHGLGER